MPQQNLCRMLKNIDVTAMLKWLYFMTCFKLQFTFFCVLSFWNDDVFVLLFFSCGAGLLALNPLCIDWAIAFGFSPHYFFHRSFFPWFVSTCLRSSMMNSLDSQLSMSFRTFGAHTKKNNRRTRIKKKNLQYSM